MYHLLIVDDEPYTVDGLYALLTGLSEAPSEAQAEAALPKLSLYRAYSAEEALDQAALAPVDIVLSDIRMPGMDGIELQSTIRKIRPDSRFIFLTGMNDVNTVRRAMRNGGSDYILKTEGDEPIIAAIRTAIDAISADPSATLGPQTERPGEPQRKAAAEAPHWLVDKIHHFIHERLAADVSLTAIADEVNMNPTYVSELYKQLAGRNLSETIAEVRLQRAKHLLSTTNLKIHKIASLIGFENAAYFTRFFRKHTALGPQQYRNRNIRIKEKKTK